VSSQNRIFTSQNSISESSVEKVAEFFVKTSLVAVKLLTIRCSLFVDLQGNSLKKQRTVINEQRLCTKIKKKRWF
jgi:hypothetical protein